MVARIRDGKTAAWVLGFIAAAHIFYRVNRAPKIDATVHELQAKLGPQIEYNLKKKTKLPFYIAAEAMNSPLRWVGVMKVERATGNPDCVKKTLLADEATFALEAKAATDPKQAFESLQENQSTGVQLLLDEFALRQRTQKYITTECG